MPINTAVIAGSLRHWATLHSPRVGPVWLPLVWTALFSAAVALVFTQLDFAQNGVGSAAPWAVRFGPNLVIALVFGFTIHGLYALALMWMGGDGPQRLTGWRRTLFYAGVPIVGSLVAWPIGFTLATGDLRWLREQAPRAFAAMLLLSIAMALAFHAVVTLRTRRIAARMHATEAQLKLLQAQIEPHFLFNTLANVQSLIDCDAPRAKAMLESFIDYLRLSLPQLRRELAPLGAELDLIGSYLELLALRMAGRLRYEIDADAAAREAMIPPLLVQPLVENAIRHGLEPKVEGGLLRVQASIDAGRLVIVVSDDGRGLDAPRRPGPPGSGVGLDNVRARLAARYGHRGRLTLERLATGTRATLELPVQ